MELASREKITRQKHSGLIRVSVEKGFGQMKYLVPFIFLGGVLVDEVGWRGGLLTVDHSSRS